MNKEVPNGKIAIKIYGHNGSDTVRFSCVIDAKEHYPLLAAMDKLMKAQFANWTFQIVD